MQQSVPNAPQSNLKDACYTKAATVLGVLHIICGVISIGAESAFLDSKYSIDVYTGIWSAVFFFISGALSIGGAQSGNKCLVVATQVMSIISAVLAGILLGLSATWLAHLNHSYVTTHAGTSVNYGYSTYAYYVAQYNQAESSLGLLIAMGVIMLGVSIASASLTCKLLCCRSNNQGAVHYNPNQGAYNPNQGPYNLNQGAYNPNQGPYNPNQGAYNPNQEPSNVLVNPNYNPNQIAPVNSPNV